ncbi:MAG: hypothetical protein QME42_11095 [bacterium]|nr:hypothetical protein [bacterium]
MVNRTLFQEWIDKADEDFEFALKNLFDMTLNDQDYIITTLKEIESR